MTSSIISMLHNTNRADNAMYGVGRYAKNCASLESATDTYAFRKPMPRGM